MRELSLKTKSLNAIRRIFKFRPIEVSLVHLTKGRAPDSLIAKLIPSCYLYDKNSLRIVSRHDINYRLDISDLIDWHIYFGLRDLSHERLLTLLSEDMIIFDIGCNNGALLLRFCKACPKGFVIGIEPSARNWERLQANLALNQMSNHQVFNFGAGDKEDLKYITYLDSNNLGMTIVSTSDTNGELTKIKSIKAVYESLALPRVDLMKIDVEGYELKILKGAEALIFEFKPILFIEIDDCNLRREGSSARVLFEYLTTNFRYTIIDSVSGLPICDDFNFSRCHFDAICLWEKNA